MLENWQLFLPEERKPASQIIAEYIWRATWPYKPEVEIRYEPMFDKMGYKFIITSPQYPDHVFVLEDDDELGLYDSVVKTGDSTYASEQIGIRAAKFFGSIPIEPTPSNVELGEN